MGTESKKPLIEKKIIYTGTKNVSFTPGTRVFFHFQTKLCDNDKTILDDSRKIGTGKPMELVLGKKFKMEVWETVVQMMSLNEVAQFTVDKSLVLQYPFVSKTLRDVTKPNSQRTKSCCGAMLQNEGVGYRDLNELINKPQDLEFTIELLKVEASGEYTKESWQLTEEEKLKMVPELREKGNMHFKNSEYDNAVDLYSTAIGYIEQLCLKEKPHDTEWDDLQKLKVPLLLNLSQCYLLKEEFYSAIEHCNSVLKIEPDNVKAFFRRAKGHLGAWNLEEARSDFLKVSELDSSLLTTVNKHLKELDEKKKKQHERDKQESRKYFAK